MRILHLTMAAGLALSVISLSACQSTQDVSAICRNIEKDHKAFVAIAATGLIKGAAVNIEAAAYKSTQPICANPTEVTLVDAITLAANAYAEIKEALRQAKAAKAAG